MFTYSVHPKKRNTVFLSRFSTFWLNAMVASPRTAFYLPQFTKNPRTLTDIFTTRRITPNIRSSLLPIFHRINTHITDNKQKHSELQNISSTLRLNRFPTRTTFLTSRQPRSQNTQYYHFTSIP